MLNKGHISFPFSLHIKTVTYQVHPIAHLLQTFVLCIYRQLIITYIITWAGQKTLVHLPTGKSPVTTEKILKGGMPHNWSKPPYSFSGETWNLREVSHVFVTPKLHTHYNMKKLILTNSHAPTFAAQ